MQHRCPINIPNLQLKNKTKRKTGEGFFCIETFLANYAEEIRELESHRSESLHGKMDLDQNHQC